MSYLTLAELTDYGADELTDVDTDLAQRWLTASSELVDQRLAGGIYDYVLPLEPVPTLIKQIVADLARAGIASGNRIWEGERLEALERREKLAHGLLDKIAKGEIQLGAAYFQTASGLVDGSEILVSSRPRRGF